RACANIFLPVVPIFCNHFLVKRGNRIFPDFPFEFGRLEPPCFFFVFSDTIMYRREFFAEAVDKIANCCALSFATIKKDASSHLTFSCFCPQLSVIAAVECPLDMRKTFASNL